MSKIRNDRKGERKRKRRKRLKTAGKENTTGTPKRYVWWWCHVIPRKCCDFVRMIRMSKESNDRKSWSVRLLWYADVLRTNQRQGYRKNWIKFWVVDRGARVDGSSTWRRELRISQVLFNFYFRHLLFNAYKSAFSTSGFKGFIQAFVWSINIFVVL